MRLVGEAGLQGDVDQRSLAAKVIAGAMVGVRRGVPCLQGITLGMGAMIAIVAFGIGSVILDRPQLLAALKWIAIAFLLWLAWKIATAESGEERDAPVVMGCWQAAAFQWVNPKLWVVSASAAGTFLTAGAGALVQSLSLGSLFVLAALPSCFVWLLFGATLQRLLRTPRALRIQPRDGRVAGRLGAPLCSLGRVLSTAPQ